jgi:hypothetical protein
MSFQILPDAPPECRPTPPRKQPDATADEVNPWFECQINRHDSDESQQEKENQARQASDASIASRTRRMGAIGYHASAMIVFLYTTSR